MCVCVCGGVGGAGGGVMSVPCFILDFLAYRLVFVSMVTFIIYYENISCNSLIPHCFIVKDFIFLLTPTVVISK